MENPTQKLERLQLTPTLWSKFSHVDKVAPLSDDDYAVLNEIKQVLEKHNAVDRFGVSLIHRHFELKEDEIVFETTNEEARVQQIEVCASSSIKDRSDILETQWVFDGGQNLVCVKYCDYNHGHVHIHQFKQS